MHPLASCSGGETGFVGTGRKFFSQASPALGVAANGACRMRSRGCPRSWVSRVGRSSFVIDGQIRDGHEVLSSARVVMVAFDAAAQRPCPLTGPQRMRLLARSTRDETQPQPQPRAGV